MARSSLAAHSSCALGEHVVLAEDEILNARLGACTHPLLPVLPDVFEAARKRAVHDMATHAGDSGDLEDTDVGDELRDRRTALAVALGRVAAGCAESIGETLDDVGVFVVEGDAQAGLADSREDLEQLARVIAWEAYAR